MIARYPGKCDKCGSKVNIGDQITWNRKRRGIVYHLNCSDHTQSNVPSEDHSFSNYNNFSESIKHNNDFDTPLTNTTETETDRGTDTMTEIHSNGNGDLAATLAQAIADYLPQQKAILDESAITEIIKREMQSLIMPTRVELFVPETQEIRDMGVQHKNFPTLLKVLSTKLNIWLAGPSGSGKTQAAMNAASALNLKFYFCGAQSNEYGLSGYIDAQGKTVRTLFREAYEFGGVFLFDEVDASSPNALLWLNAALSNGHCAFPDAVIERHPDFVCIAAANTWGLGGTNDYVGRFKMDAAFLKRFVFVSWDYDEALELAICGNIEWAKRVQDVRARVRSKGIKVIISPRETLYGAKLLATGIAQDTVEDMTIFAGLSKEQKDSVK